MHWFIYVLCMCDIVLHLNDCDFLSYVDLTIQLFDGVRRAYDFTFMIFLEKIKQKI